MSIVLYHQAGPDKSAVDQVLKLVASFCTDLRLDAIPASNAFYSLYQWALVCEVESYIERIGYANAPVELLLAFDEMKQDEVVGFLLYLPVMRQIDTCGVCYMAVKSTHQGRGIGKNLLAAMLDRYPHAELTCSVSNVEFYESMGFSVVGTHSSQVAMSTRAQATEGEILLIDSRSILGSPEARKRQMELEQRWGKKEMRYAIQQFERHVSKLVLQADNFVKERLGR
ncbi:putative acetyltransferase [Pseudomonas coronafaciens pv. zizaniae]|uniref:GNAT family N-acetyltransferase n=1 Tax=Pseudomonas syringae group TaxID=136849 RepID=UPI0006D627F2|nr:MULTISPECIES: GNAT family N-acetyltransferase [Pseudomonas syringae group]RMO05553.1 putative acetyltransferase [Pseudomonas coronafaciens pv. zizaniae]